MRLSGVSVVPYLIITSLWRLFQNVKFSTEKGSVCLKSGALETLQSQMEENYNNLSL